MSQHQKEPVFQILSLGELVKILPNDSEVVQASPDECSECGGPLTLSWDIHSSGTNEEGHRCTWWVAWATCPMCKLFFVRRSPPRSAEERGWLLETNPPEFVVRDSDLSNKLQSKIEQQVAAIPYEPISSKAFSISLEVLGLSMSVKNCLESEGIITAGDICVRTGEELLEIRNFGELRLQEVREKLAAFGLRLQEDSVK